MKRKWVSGDNVDKILEKEKCKIFSISIDKWCYSALANRRACFLFGSLDQAWGSILSDVKDQELVLPATCHNQQKNISAIPPISTRVFPFEISYIQVQIPKVFQAVLRNFQEYTCLKRFLERITRCKRKLRGLPEVSYQLLTNWSRKFYVCFLVAE